MLTIVIKYYKTDELIYKVNDNEIYWCVDFDKDWNLSKYVTKQDLLMREDCTRLSLLDILMMGISE